MSGAPTDGCRCDHLRDAHRSAKKPVGIGKGACVICGCPKFVSRTCHECWHDHIPYSGPCPCGCPESTAYCNHLFGNVPALDRMICISCGVSQAVIDLSTVLLP